MKIDNWLIASILSLILWGISGFFMKVSTFKLDNKLAFIIQSIGASIVVLIIAIVYFSVTNKMVIKQIFTNEKFFILSSLLAGITGGLGTFLLLKAYEKGNLTTVTVITALYPLVAIILGILILKEKLTLIKLIAIFLSLIAIVLFSL